MTAAPFISRLAGFFLALLCAAAAHAGAIFFSLDLDHGQLKVTNQGGDSAFYPAAYRLQGDGRWEALAVAGGNVPPAELANARSIVFTWPPQTGGVSPLTNTGAVMVRFFDQAGSGFGQISFFKTPPPVEQVLEAAYHGGTLRLNPPDQAGSAWLLWAEEEGIAPLRHPVEFSHHQAPARHVEWIANGPAQVFGLGAGQPGAMLLRETGADLQLQILPSGGRQGREQRSAWLDLGPQFTILAIVLLVIAALILLGSLVYRRRFAPGEKP